MSQSDKEFIYKDQIESLRAAILNAREAGMAFIRNHEGTTDDPDCYPRGVKVLINRNSLEWRLLKEFEKEFAWFRLNGQSGMLTISVGLQIRNRLTLYGFQQAVADSLSKSGIDCYADVSWRD